MLRTFCCIRLVIATALAVSITSSNALAAFASDDPIKIGFITSLTGAAAPGGNDMLNGIKLYMDEIHNEMAGRKVQLVIENDGSSPATAAAGITKLANEDKCD